MYILIVSNETNILYSVTESYNNRHAVENSKYSLKFKDILLMLFCRGEETYNSTYGCINAPSSLYVNNSDLNKDLIDRYVLHCKWSWWMRCATSQIWLFFISYFYSALGWVYVSLVCLSVCLSVYLSVCMSHLPNS